ncbi:MAG: hypothetical protein ACFFB3_01290 [Candidatus Hodarchaeota archaeon]
MRDKGTLTQMRMMYKGSRPLHKGAFVVSVFFFLWMFSGLTGWLWLGEPVWMYTGRGTTISHFFPFRIKHVTDLEGGDVVIETDVGLTFDSVSWITYVLALAFVLALVPLWLPVIPEIFGSENLRDSAIGFLSLLFFMLLVLSALEDAKSFSYGTDFDEKVAEHQLISSPGVLWTWEEYAEYAGIRGDSDYQLYLAVSLLLFTLTAAILTGSIFGMMLSSRLRLLRQPMIADTYNRSARNVSLVLTILFAAATVTTFVSLLAFTEEADFLPGLPIFMLLLLMSGASFVDWKNFNLSVRKEEDFSLSFWVMIFVAAQIAFLIISLFFGENFLSE